MPSKLTRAEHTINKYKKRLDLKGGLCYNSITSEKVFFFAKKVRKALLFIYCMCFALRLQYVAQGQYVKGLREAQLPEYSGKINSVKREVPL